MTIRGSCQCGNVAYRLEEDMPTGAMACNCSICRRKAYLLHFTAPQGFTLETDRDAVTVYTFNSHNIRHQFCKTCGCAPFGEGTGPDGNAMVAINLRCVDGVDLDALKITNLDGANL